MRVSEIFNRNDKRALIVKTFLDDGGTAHILEREGMSLPKGLSDEQRESMAYHAFARLSDPTFDPDNPDGNKYLEWISKIYADQAGAGTPVKTEDLAALREELAYFDKAKTAFKNAGYSTDIQEYQNLEQFSGRARPLLNKQQSRRPRRLTSEIKDQTTVLYEGPEGKVVVPHTAKASQYWGNATRWCISGTENAHANFPYYNKKGAPIMMLVPNVEGLPEGRNGKIAIMNGEVWDETDNIDTNQCAKDKLPSYVQDLCDAALTQGDKGKSAYFRIFKEKIVPEENGDNAWDTEEIEDSLPDTEKTLEERFPELNYVQHRLLEQLVEMPIKYPDDVHALFDEHPQYRADVNFMQCVVQIDGLFLAEANHEVLKNDLHTYRGLIRIAVENEQYGVCITDADHHALDSDPDYPYAQFAQELVEINPHAFSFLNHDLLAREPEFYKKFVFDEVSQRRGLSLSIINEPSDAVIHKNKENNDVREDRKFFQDDMDFYVNLCMAAVKKDGWALLHVDADTIIEKKGMGTYCDIVEAAAGDDARSLKKARLKDILEYSVDRYFDIFKASVHFRPRHDYMADKIQPLKHMDNDILISHNKQGYYDACLCLLRNYPEMLEDLHPDLNADPDFLVDAFCANSKVFDLIDKQTIESPEFIERLLHKVKDGENVVETLNVLENIHRFPAFFGRVTADFDALLEHVQSIRENKNESELFLTQALGTDSPDAG